MQDVAVLRADEDVEDLLDSNVVVWLAYVDRLENPLLLAHLAVALALGEVYLEDVVALPVVVEDFVVSDHEAVVACRVHKHLTELHPQSSEMVLVLDDPGVALGRSVALRGELLLDYDLVLGSEYPEPVVLQVGALELVVKEWFSEPDIL